MYCTGGALMTQNHKQREFFEFFGEVEERDLDILLTIWIDVVDWGRHVQWRLNISTVNQLHISGYIQQYCKGWGILLLQQVMGCCWSKKLIFEQKTCLNDCKVENILTCYSWAVTQKFQNPDLHCNFLLRCYLYS